jgi:equilibrative nucleoside transporter 1/2/3
MGSSSEHDKDVENNQMDTEDKDKEPENQELFLSFALGNASLLAFNVIINAFDVYEELIGRVGVSQDLTRSYQFPSSITALMLCFLKPKNLKASLNIALITLTAGFTILPILFLANVGAGGVFIGAVVSIVAVACASAVTFSSTFSLTSQFGPKSGAIASSGVGCCGVLATILRMITKAAIKNPRISAGVYFLLAFLLFLLILVFFLIKSRNPEVEQKLLADNGSGENALSKESLINTWETLKVVWIEWLSVAFCFMVTLTLFPGYTTGVRLDRKIGSWTYVLITGLFGVFDWVGRYLPSLFIWPERKYAWVPNAARAAFFVILMISIQGLVDFNEPWWTIGWMVPFAITNGYSGTVSLIYGCNHEKLSMTHRKYAGLLVSCSVNVGILCSMGLTFALPKPRPIPFT